MQQSGLTVNFGKEEKFPFLLLESLHACSLRATCPAGYSESHQTWWSLINRGEKVHRLLEQKQKSSHVKMLQTPVYISVKIFTSEGLCLIVWGASRQMFLGIWLFINETDVMWCDVKVRSCKMYFMHISANSWPDLAASLDIHSFFYLLSCSFFCSYPSCTLKKATLKLCCAWCRRGPVSNFAVLLY